MDFNDLLGKKGIPLEQVLVLRHRPSEKKLAKFLPTLASERPDLFNAYQRTQTKKVENAMTRASYIASFIGHQAGKALFVGIYSIGESTALTRDQYWEVQAHRELKEKYEMRGFAEEDGRPVVLRFDLALTDAYASWKGKLIVEWPPPEISWSRWAHRNTFPVHAVLEESRLDRPMPHWDEVELEWEDLKILPRSWESKLEEWRGIYYISDSSDGKGYVGSAYGKDNLLGRWRKYGATGHGGNSLLRERAPRNFRFTILQRVSPDMEADEVIRLEGTWKRRLHSRDPLGLNEN